MTCAAFCFFLIDGYTDKKFHVCEMEQIACKKMEKKISVAPALQTLTRKDFFKI